MVQKEHMNEIYSIVEKTVTPATRDHMDVPFASQELATDIAQAPKNKSPGIDGIITEFYTWGQDIFQDELLTMYNEFLSTGYIQSTQTQGVFVSPKKGQTPNC